MSPTNLMQFYLPVNAGNKYLPMKVIALTFVKNK